MLQCIALFPLLFAPAQLLCLVNSPVVILSYGDISVLLGVTVTVEGYRVELWEEAGRRGVY